jgi:hypothetical protein
MMAAFVWLLSAFRLASIQDLSLTFLYRIGDDGGGGLLAASTSAILTLIIRLTGCG